MKFNLLFEILIGAYRRCFMSVESGSPVGLSLQTLPHNYQPIQEGHSSPRTGASHHRGNSMPEIRHGNEYWLKQIRKDSERRRRERRAKGTEAGEAEGEEPQAKYSDTRVLPSGDAVDDMPPLVFPQNAAVPPTASEAISLLSSQPASLCERIGRLFRNCLGSF